MISFGEKQSQTLANCRALFNHYGLPQLIATEAAEDRCFFELTDRWMFKYADLPAGTFESNNVLGVREHVPRFSMELTFGKNKRGDLVECDFDYYNPNYGAYYAMMHFFCELLPHKLCGFKTDPFKVARGLQKRGINVDNILTSSG